MGVSDGGDDYPSLITLVAPEDEEYGNCTIIRSNDAYTGKELLRSYEPTCEGICTDAHADNADGHDILCRFGPESTSWEKPASWAITRVREGLDQITDPAKLNPTYACGAATPEQGHCNSRPDRDRDRRPLSVSQSRHLVFSMYSCTKTPSASSGARYSWTPSLCSVGYSQRMYFSM